MLQKFINFVYTKRNEWSILQYVWPLQHFRIQNAAHKRLRTCGAGPGPCLSPAVMVT